MNPEAPKLHAAADDGRIVIGRNDDHRHARILSAHIHQPGESARARHCKVEQHQIDVAAPIEQLDEFIKGARFSDIHSLEQSTHGLAQRAAKQRVIIGDDQSVLHGFSQPQLPFDQIGRPRATDRYSIAASTEANAIMRRCLGGHQ